MKEELVIVCSARAQFKCPARVGDRLTACAKVGTHKDDKYVVSVRTRVGNAVIFVGRFVVVAINESLDIDAIKDSFEENTKSGEPD